MKQARLHRIAAFAVSALLLFSSTASAIPEASRFSKACWQQFFVQAVPYTESPGPIFYGSNPQVQPNYRGYFYSDDDIAAINTADAVEAGTASIPSPAPYYPNGLNDSGDNSILDGRPGPASANQFTENASAHEDLTHLLAMVGGTSKAQQSQVQVQGTIQQIAPTSDTPSGTLIPIGSLQPTPGQSFGWEGSGPGGGSDIAPGVVCPQTGNRQTTMPIVGWRVPGGMTLGLTLFHNSQDNVDIGWGTNWRSSFDMRLVYAGTRTLSGQTLDKITVTYPSGTRLVYTRQLFLPSALNVFYPPTGFYDVLSATANGAYSLRTKNQIKYSFDAYGYLQAISDRYGNQILVNRDPSTHYINSVTDAAGDSLVFTNSQSIISQNLYRHYTSVSVGSTTYTMTYGPQAFSGIPVLRNVAWPALGSNTYTESFNYDQAGAIVNEGSRDGKTYSFTYDNYERCTSFSYPVPFYLNPIQSAKSVGNLTYTYTYGPTATTLTDPLNHIITSNYSNGCLVSVVDQAGYSDSYTWDKNYNLTVYRGKRSTVPDTSYFQYDNYGNRISSANPVQYAAGVSQKTTYNNFNDITSATDCSGSVTTLNRSTANGQLLSVVDGLNNTLITNSYEPNGDIASTTTENATTTFTYDSSGRPSAVQTPDQTYSFSYNESPIPGLLYSLTDQLGRTSRLNYDAWGRPTSMVRPDGSSASIQLDPADRPTTVTDFNNITSYFQYDAAGRAIAYQNGNGNVQRVSWWDMEHVAGVTDGNGHTRTYAYDARWEGTSPTLADGMVEQFQYDADGNVTSHTNGLGQVTNFQYDGASELIATTYPNGTGITYKYDPDGRATSMTDATGVSSWTYDLGNRVVGFNSPEGSVSYTYDAWGRRLSSKTSDGSSITYTYSRNRLVSLTKLPENETTSWGFDSIGRLTSQLLPNGGVASYSYDSLDRLQSVTQTVGSLGAFNSESYSYDGNQNLTKKVINGLATYYRYDAANQLTQESNGPTSQLSTWWIAYSYDANGNRVNRSGSGGLNETYAYDAGDKLTAVLSGNIPVKNYSYDQAGRVTSIATASGTKAFTYDFEDRVVGISGLPTTNSYTYNGADARVGKQDSTGNHKYLRDGADATDPILTDGTTSYNPGISRHDSLGSSFYHDDFLGTHRAESNSAGSVVATRSYDSFGNALAGSSIAPGGFGFAGSHGYQEDPDSGYKLVGHRIYDPSIGRFVTRDPERSGRNWFTYCANNPLSHVDPTGLFWREIGGIGGAILGAATGNPFLAAGGCALGSFLGSLADGDNVQQAATNGAIDGACDLVGGFLIGKCLIFLRIAAKVSAPAGEALGEGVGKALLDGAEEIAGTGCFTKGTRILLPDGSSKPIEEIKPGDKVLSRNVSSDNNAPTESATVTKTTHHTHSATLKLRLVDGGVVETTEEHPFYVIGYGFKPARDLIPGEKLADSAGGSHAVKSVTIVEEPAAVYNLTVARDHSFFVKVGKTWLWVHNSCQPGVYIGIKGGKLYVGQSINMARRAAQHLDKGEPVFFIPMPNSTKLDREIVEHLIIKGMRRNGTTLANKINPIGPAREAVLSNVQIIIRVGAGS